MKTFFLTIFLFTSITTWAEPKTGSTLRDISITEAATALKENKELIIIDVRTAKEFEKEHLKGAKNIDIKDDQFENKIAKLDRTKNYLIHCRSGVRSAKALKVFRKLNFENVLHMKDGLLGWAKENQPTSK